MAATGRTNSVTGGMGSLSTPANNHADGGPGNRRSSQEGTMFSGLMNHKRNGSDAAAAARRQSFNEMKPTAGYFGQMWNNFTKGNK